MRYRAIYGKRKTVKERGAGGKGDKEGGRERGGWRGSRRCGWRDRSHFNSQQCVCKRQYYGEHAVHRETEIEYTFE